MMSEEKARKVLDNLVRDIAVSTKRSKALSQLTNKELAEKLISDVWGISKLFGEKSDLLTEAIERLSVLDIPERVRCTADGEYPEENRRVHFEIGNVEVYYGYAKKDAYIGIYFVTSNKPSYAFAPNYLPEPIYWRYEEPTSLKDEYEKEKDGE